MPYYTVPSAEDFFDIWAKSKGYTCISDLGQLELEYFADYARAFAKAHLEAAMHAVSNKATASYDNFGAHVNKASIINAYPQDNIK